MVIAVIGWGSLIWNPGGLPLGSGWFADGPSLPIEFVRQSEDDRLTLVIHGKKTVPTLWAKMDVKTLEQARQHLGWRERIIKRSNDKMSRHIGWWKLDKQSSDKDYPYGHEIEIQDWARGKNLHGVVWTALPPKFGTEKADAGKFPTAEEATKHLKSLKGASRDLAFEYIRKAPEQIITPYRKVFQKEFDEL